MVSPRLPLGIGMDDALARLRLLQLTSPTLPTGAFTYSQGLEWAVEVGWVTDELTCASWIGGLLDDGMAYLDIPILKRLYDACTNDDESALRHWGAQLYAGRESSELRAEERTRARAMSTLLKDFAIPEAVNWSSSLGLCQAAPFALAAKSWGVSAHDCALGYAWSWLENQVAAAIKLVPLGQTTGQRLQFQFAPRVTNAVRIGLDLPDADIGAAAPAFAIASARHETQYTRLFRS